jgi:Carbon-nitrogen hydrolase
MDACYYEYNNSVPLLLLLLSFHMIHLSTRQRTHIPVIRVLFSSTSLAAACWMSCCRAMLSTASPPGGGGAVVSSTRIAVAQLCSTSNKYQNLLNIAKCAGQARRDKASMLFLPENCGFMGSSASETLANAESPVVASTNGDYSISMSSSKHAAMVSQTLMERVNAFSEGKSIDNKEEETNAVVDNSDVSLLDGLANIARASNLWISVGGIHERGAPPRMVSVEEEENGKQEPEAMTPRTYNTHVILDSDGQIRAVYRKIHLFDVAIPGKVNLQESASTAPGDQIVTCDSPIGM